jgi:hypothetical protein
VLYKTEADPDGRLWPVGPFPDRNRALDHFNNTTAKQGNIGPFTFEETSAFLPLYNLVEQEPPNGPETLYPLYEKQDTAGAKQLPEGEPNNTVPWVPDDPTRDALRRRRPSRTAVLDTNEVPPPVRNVIVPPQQPPENPQPVLSSGLGSLAGDRLAPVAGSSAAAEARVSDTQPSEPVQSYLVTTPLDGRAELISLTLRFQPTLHNIVSDTIPELFRADLAEGWTRETMGSGDALLDRLAGEDASLRSAIVQALDDRAAMLRFSDPAPFRSGDLKRIKDGIVAFSRLKPRTAFVGVITLGACLIAVQVSWGVGAGLSATAEYAVTEVGKALVDAITARIRETNTR